MTSILNYFATSCGLQGRRIFHVLNSKQIAHEAFDARAVKIWLWIIVVKIELWESVIFWDF